MFLYTCNNLVISSKCILWILPELSGPIRVPFIFIMVDYVSLFCAQNFNVHFDFWNVTLVWQIFICHSKSFVIFLLSFCVTCEAKQHIGITFSGVCLSVRLSVCPSGSHTFLVVTHSYVSQMLPICLQIFVIRCLLRKCSFCSIVQIFMSCKHLTHLS